jgi:hypothetical protein
MALLLLSAITMTTTQAVAQAYANKNVTQCLLDTNYAVRSHFDTLNLPSWVLVFPNVTSGIALPLIYITILEFLSAQSPHTMKGLLLGAFYAVRGIFTILGCSLVFPFANNMWQDKREPFDCGLSYYTTSTLLGATGLVLFCLAARWYQYRQRDDEPFDGRFAEAWVQRQIQAREVAAAENSEVGLLGNASILDYGTTIGT